MRKKIVRLSSKKDQSFLDKPFRTVRWQHEDTGRTADIPVGKSLGHRWYKIPSSEKKEIINMITLASNIKEKDGILGIKIPDSVLVDLLLVYENGTEEMLKSLPNDFICNIDGDFWTTWRKVFEIRSRIQKQKRKKILFRKFEREKHES